MTNFEKLKEAINTLKPVAFTYKGSPVRIGNPYAIYILDNNSTKIHIVQTKGFTESGRLGSFKQFNVEDMDNVSILTDESSFVPDHPDYKPESPFYKNVLAKV